MLADTDRQRRRWASGRGAALPWNSDDRTYAALLDALTEDLADARVAELERLAPARRSQADVNEEEQQLRADELAEAREELGTFRAALGDARARGGPGDRGEVDYDSSDPQQDRLADALIQHLVRTGYGEVRTEDMGGRRYRYFIRVNWARLEALARDRGHPLPH